MISVNFLIQREKRGNEDGKRAYLPSICGVSPLAHRHTYRTNFFFLCDSHCEMNDSEWKLRELCVCVRVCVCAVGEGRLLRNSSEESTPWLVHVAAANYR